jgi:hypothetical protein
VGSGTDFTTRSARIKQSRRGNDDARHCEPTDPREVARSDGRLRKAIQGRLAMTARPFWIASSPFGLLAMTRYTASDEEAACSVHHGEPPEWHALCRRDFESAATSLATPDECDRWIHEAIRVQDACLVRTALRHAQCHCSREADQSRIEKKETGSHRRNKSDLARPVRGTHLTRHCERSEAIQGGWRWPRGRSGLLRRPLGSSQ